MTGTEFLAYVKRKFKRTDKDTELYEAMTDTIALMKIKFKSDKYKEETAVSGISTLGEYRLGLPSDFGHIIGNISITDTADDSQYDPLKKISKQKYDELYTDRLLTAVGNVNTALPRHFCVYSDQLYLGPVPDKTTYKYQMNYTTEESTDVVAGTDPVPFTQELRFRNVLRNGVLFEIYDGMENFEEASYYKSTFLDGLNDIILMEERNMADEGTVCYNDF